MSEERTTSADEAQTTKPATIKIEPIEISLNESETFCGAILKDDGTVDHYVILLPTPSKRMNWDGCAASAQERGGVLPSSRESHLLVTNARAKLPSWFYMDKLEGSSNAWYCGSYGSQGYSYRSAEGGAVAVRRVFPSVL